MRIGQEPISNSFGLFRRALAGRFLATPEKHPRSVIPILIAGLILATMRQRMAAGWILIRAVTQYAQGVRGSLHRLPEIVLGDIRDPLKAGSDFIAELGLNDSGIPLGDAPCKRSMPIR